MNILIHDATVTKKPPRPCDLLISGAWLLDADADGEVEATPSSVAVTGTQIVDVGADAVLASRWRPEKHINAAGCVIAPGFVDAHVHLGAFLGAAETYRRPSEPSPFGGSGDPTAALRMVARFCSMDLPAELLTTLLRPVFASMLRSGYTGVVDAGGPGWEGAWIAARETGIRASIGPSLADSWHDDSGTLARHTDATDLLGRAEEFVAARIDATDTVVPLVSAVDVLGCSDDLLTGIAAIGERFGIPVHVHSHIGKDDHAASVAAYGRGSTERLEMAGLMTERTTIMHAGVLSDGDIAAFARHGVTVNHNPVGNAMYGFGVGGERSVPRLMAAGVPIVLGTDWAPVVTGPFELMHSALMMQRDSAADDLALSLEAVIAMTTRAGVPLGQPDRVGTLAPGQLADLLVIDLAAPHHLGSTHPVTAVALHARPEDVRTVVVNGRVVVEHGRLTALDEDLALTEARTALRSMH